MLKNVALDSAATALALWEEVKAVIRPMTLRLDYQQLYANYKAQFEHFTYQHGFPISRRAE